VPELQEVRQDLAGIREMIAAATELARADTEATAATRALSDELDSLVAPVADVAEAMGIAAGSRPGEAAMRGLRGGLSFLRAGADRVRRGTAG
jgi:hypothetical protein